MSDILLREILVFCIFCKGENGFIEELFNFFI